MILTTEKLNRLRLIVLNTIGDVGSDIVVVNTVDTYIGGSLVSTPTNTPYKADIGLYESNEVSSLILATDIKLMIPNNLMINIDANSTITIDSVSHQVVRVIPEIKKNVTLYYMVQARR
jgi:hypothetical protein